MYYKVIKNNKIIDVLDDIIFLKWYSKYKIMVLSSQNEAQAILSSDRNTIWHEKTLHKVPVDGIFDTVEVVKIDEYEYKQLKVLNGKTPEEIIDEYTLLLIERGIL